METSVPRQFTPAIQKRQFDDRSDADDTGAEVSHERGRCAHRSARGQDVVDDEDAIAGVDGVVVDLQNVLAVFELVFVAALGPRQLAGLADGNESAIQNARHATTEDESS